MTSTTPEDATEPPKMENEVNPKKRPMAEDSDGEKLAARREANRIHALKSRQRSKALLQELQRTVTQLSGEKAELERENAVMRAQIEVLQQQNLALTQSQRMLLMRSGQLGAGAPGAAAMNAFAPGLFGLSQAASMPAAAAAAAPNTATANAPAAASNDSTGATNGGTNGKQQQQQAAGAGLDQAAVAAAAAAMIQGQAAAAAAAAAGFQPQFQQFMAGFNMGGGIPGAAPAAPVPASTTITATPTPRPTPNTTAVAPPPALPVTTTDVVEDAPASVPPPQPQALPNEEPVV